MSAAEDQSLRGGSPACHHANGWDDDAAADVQEPEGSSRLPAANQAAASESLARTAWTWLKTATAERPRRACVRDAIGR